jgi:hypothetical protein
MSIEKYTAITQHCVCWPTRSVLPGNASDWCTGHPLGPALGACPQHATTARDAPGVHTIYTTTYMKTYTAGKILDAAMSHRAAAGIVCLRQCLHTLHASDVCNTVSQTWAMTAMTACVGSGTQKCVRSRFDQLRANMLKVQVWVQSRHLKQALQA